MLAGWSGVAGGTRVEVTFEDNQAVLCNPGMGWHVYHNDGPFSYMRDLEPSDALVDFPGITVVYMRLPWSYLEPEEGHFNWWVLDTPMQRWVERGKKVAFRITCCESSMTYATPHWVRDAGAKGHEFKGINSPLEGMQWEPDYNDPVFLWKLDHFLQAFAERYDGHPNVDHIDIGSFGVWGEGHTWRTSGLAYDFDTVRRHIDLNRKHFKKTQLVISDDIAHYGRGPDTIRYARHQGVTLRDDSILVDGEDHAYGSDQFAQDFWLTLPVILETVDYPGLTPKWDGGKKFLEAVEKYHASYTSVHGYPRVFLRENRELVHQISMRHGYRLQLLKASWPQTFVLEEQASIEFSALWRNSGVAPCLPDGYPALTLKDAKGGIAAVSVDRTFSMRCLPVGAPGLASAREQKMTLTPLPRLAEGLKVTMNRRPPLFENGVYQILISVGTMTGQPTIQLPLDHDDGHRRYRIGQMTIQVEH
jgi:glycosyl hydrolase family 42 (putative beta-galactosidase)